MEFKTVEDALLVFGETVSESKTRAEAKQFIRNLDPQISIPQLVDALQNDHFGVRWEAAELLAHIGCAALPEILKALVDPNRVGDPRLRDGVYHVLHHNRDAFVHELTGHLMHVLHGSAPDLETMREANHLLQEITGCPQGY